MCVCVCVCDTDLSSKNVVGEHNHGGSVRYKVGHRFHDIPRVFPPRKPRKEPKLQRHECHPTPYHNVGAAGRLLGKL